MFQFLIPTRIFFTPCSTNPNTIAFLEVDLDRFLDGLHVEERRERLLVEIQNLVGVSNVAHVVYLQVVPYVVHPNLVEVVHLAIADPSHLEIHFEPLHVEAVEARTLRPSPNLPSAGSVATPKMGDLAPLASLVESPVVP